MSLTDPHAQTQSTWADVPGCHQGTWSSELWAVLLLNIPQTHLVPCLPCSSPQESPHQHSAAPAPPESVLQATAIGSFYTCIADLCFTAFLGPQNRAQQPWVCAPATGSASHALSAATSWPQNLCRRRSLPRLSTPTRSRHLCPTSLDLGSPVTSGNPCLTPQPRPGLLSGCSQSPRSLLHGLVTFVNVCV